MPGFWAQRRAWLLSGCFHWGLLLRRFWIAKPCSLGVVKVKVGLCGLGCPYLGQGLSCSLLGGGAAPAGPTLSLDFPASGAPAPLGGDCTLDPIPPTACT